MKKNNEKYHDQRSWEIENIKEILNIFKEHFLINDCVSYNSFIEKLYGLSQKGTLSALEAFAEIPPEIEKDAEIKITQEVHINNKFIGIIYFDKQKECKIHLSRDDYLDLALEKVKYKNRRKK